MDQTGDFLSLAERQEVDPIKQERLEVRGHDDQLQHCLAATWCSLSACLYLQRLERQTQNMDQAQYAEFCESRQLSFGEIVITGLG